MNCAGTVALVTGGAKRVGRAIVLELGRAGCDVAIHYHRSRAEAEGVAAAVVELGRRATVIAGDLSDPSSYPKIIAETVAALGRLDVLVNNASVFQTEKPDTIDGFDLERVETMLRTNLVAPMALVHHARPHLQAGGGGKIVNLCDIAGDRPMSSSLSYSVSKAGLSALTKGLARGMAPGVQVNGVAPGIAVFPEDYSEARREALTAKVPLQREGTPEEVAVLVRYLVEKGDYITGQIVSIDGGRSLV